MAKRRSTSNSIKIFRSLLVLSLLEGILWSLCIFYSASSLGSAYYERETANLRSTTLSRLPQATPLVDTRAVLLAFREEARARLETLASRPSVRSEHVAHLVLQRTFKALREFPSDSPSEASAVAF